MFFVRRIILTSSEKDRSVILKGVQALKGNTSQGDLATEVEGISLKMISDPSSNTITLN